MQRNISLLDTLLLPILFPIYNSKERLSTLRSIVKNWPTVILFRIGIKHNFTMKLRNGKTVTILSPPDYFKFRNSEEYMAMLLHTKDYDKGIEVDNEKKVARFKFEGRSAAFHYDSVMQLSNTVVLIKDQFFKERYKWLNVDGRDVIDIGANIGDSAIYFGLKNARHVYAFEPYPYSYNLALRNIKANNLEDKITILNEGCSGKISHVLIGQDYKSYDGAVLKNFGRGKEIKITTLVEIVRSFELNNAVLKIDCEGCEYKVLMDTPNDVLRKFVQIQIEYHYGYLNLRRKLEAAGFKVKNTHSRRIFNPEADDPHMFIGFLYAERLPTRQPSQ